MSWLELEVSLIQGFLLEKFHCTCFNVVTCTWICMYALFAIFNHNTSDFDVDPFSPVE